MTYGGCSAESLRRIRANGMRPCNCRHVELPSTVGGLIDDVQRGIGNVAEAAQHPAVILGGITGVARGVTEASRAVVGALPSVISGGLSGTTLGVTQRGIGAGARLIEVARRPPHIPHSIPATVMGVPLRSVVDVLDAWARMQGERNLAQMMIGIWDAVSCCASQRDDLGKLALIAWGGSFVSTTVLLPYFAAGCLYGEYLDLRGNAELLGLIPEALTGELNESIGQAARTATQLMFTKAGGPLAYQIGYTVACDQAREIIHLLDDEWYLIPFRLGQFFGPFIVDALLSAVGIGELLGISSITSRIRRYASTTFEVLVDILEAGISPQNKRTVRAVFTAVHDAEEAGQDARRALSNAPDVDIPRRPAAHGPYRDPIARRRQRRILGPGVLEAARNESEYLALLREELHRAGSAGRSWDHNRFPHAPSRKRWRAGDPVDMPDSSGVYPRYEGGPARERYWKNRAKFELEARARGEVVHDPHSKEPFRKLSDDEVRRILRRGNAPPDPFDPSRVIELEHAGVPQRVTGWLEQLGFSPEQAARITEASNPDHLMEVSRLEHAFLDGEAWKAGRWRADLRGQRWTGSLASDPRIAQPLSPLSDERIREILTLARQRRYDFARTPELRQYLRLEIRSRGLSIQPP